MTQHRTLRLVKGVIVSAAAAVACYWMWTSLRDWAQGVSAASSEEFAGFLEGLIASALGVLSMPVLLWVGMRVSGEKGNHVLVVVGAMAWLFVGGHIVEDAVSGVASTLFLALFTVLGGLTSLVEVPGMAGDQDQIS